MSTCLIVVVESKTGKQDMVAQTYTLNPQEAEAGQVWIQPSLGGLQSETFLNTKKPEPK